MPVHNSDIAEVFNDLADLLEIQGANPFRIRAYRNAARVLGTWPRSLSEIVKKDGELPKMPGLGADLAQKVSEYIRTGKLALLQETRKKVPAGLATLLKIPGLGPKRVRKLQTELKVESIADLKRAIDDGSFQKLEGLGEKTARKVSEEISRRAQAPQHRIKLAQAEEIALALLEELKSAPGVENAIVAGSFRRSLETIGDIDILVTCKNPAAISKKFTTYEDVREVIASGKTKSSVVLKTGVQVDLRIVPRESYGAALHYFTGSKAHNVAIRMMGVRRGLKINEYGVFKGARRIGGKTEDEVFASVGLPYIEPELRENRGEIEAAGERRLPRLVKLEDIRGDLHAHTVATDGRLGIEAMANAARAQGYDYLAITDHSKRLAMTGGLDRKKLLKQIHEIDRINEGFKGFRLLKAIEVDILEDGSLDLDDEILSQLDLRVGSIHSKFELSQKKQTERILRAMDNPYFNILGHPTGRLIDQRQPYEVDLERVLRGAKERGCAVELNAQPERMDLSDAQCRFAKELGVPVAVSTDAHSDHDLGYMRFGVALARRSWLEAKDILNTRPWPELRKLLKRN